MIPTRKYAALVLATLAGVAAAAFSVRAQLQRQSASSPRTAAPAVWTINRSLIVLDPAHGASDSGAVLGDHVFEKDITLAMASRLRTALTASGFTVITTREADVSDPLSPDQRAEIANRTHALACLVLHATSSGSGVHLYTSELQPTATDADTEASSAYVPVPWATAQAAFVQQSLSLSGNLNAAFAKGHLPALVAQAPMRPLDNLMCPAVAIELAPLLSPGAGATPPTDASYQQQVANALAGALRGWRDSPEVSPPIKASSEGQAAAQGKPIAAAETAGRAAAKVRTPAGSPAAQKGPQ